EAGDRGDVDDRTAAATAHRRHRRLHPEPYSLLIDADDRVPQLLAGVLESGGAEDAGVVDEDVESAELALAGIDGGAPIRRAGDIEMHRESEALARGCVDFAGEPRCLVIDHVADQNSGAFIDEEPGFGGALTARASRNQRHLALKPVHIL